MVLSLCRKLSRIIALSGLGLSLVPAIAVAAPTTEIVIYRHEYRSRVNTAFGIDYSACADTALQDEGGYLWVRAEPNVDGEKLGILRNTDPVYISKQADGWYLIQSKEDPEYGWAFGQKFYTYDCHDHHYH